MMDLAPYILVLFLLVIIFLFFKKQKTKTFLALIIVTLFSTFRYDVGVDYQEYLNIASSIQSGDTYRVIEPIYYLVVHIVDFLGINTAWVVSVYSLASGVILFFIIKYMRHGIFFLYYYIFIPLFYLQSLNLIRLTLAVLVVWLGIIIRPRRKLVSNLLFLAAIAIHYSSIIFIFTIPFWTTRLHFWHRLLFLLISCIALDGVRFFVPDLYIYYILDSTAELNLVMGLYILLFLFCWIYLEYILDNTQFVKKNLVFLCFYFVFIGTLLKLQADVRIRISYFYMLYIIQYMSDLRSKGVKLLLLMIFIFYWLYTVGVNGHMYHLIPYKLIFNN